MAVTLHRSYSAAAGGLEFSGDVITGRAGGIFKLHSIEPDRYAVQLELFLKGVRAGEPPQVTAHDGARATVSVGVCLNRPRTLSPCTTHLESVLG